jgi:hypothetical protein
MTQPINKQHYDIVVGELLGKGLNREVAETLGFNILVLAASTGKSYKSILSNITRSGINLSKEVLEQLNVMRPDGSKLGVETIKQTPNLVTREIN